MTANALLFCLPAETQEIVDYLLGDFLKKHIGKNNMNVISGMLASAAIMVVAHCERTGQDFDEAAEMCCRQFVLALKVARTKS